MAEDFRSNLLPYILLAGVLLAIVGSLGAIALTSSKPKSEITFNDASEPSPEDSGSPMADGVSIWVDVSGAVGSPGVYQLPAGSRVSDAIQKAASFSAEADWEWVHKSLNLAQVVSDGDKIYIPFTGELPIPSVAQVAGVSAGTAVVGKTTSAVNINTASANELDSLPKIGESRAKSIIEGRPYSNIEELVTKKVIPYSVYEEIKDRVIV